MNLVDAAYILASPFFLSAMYYKRWRYGKYRQSLPGMFGANLPNPPLKPHGERVWMHSVSVGETVAAGALFKALREARPDWEYLSTTTTETGQEQARERSLKDADYHDFAPVDFSWKVRRFLDAYRPSVYLFFETEIWPNILSECGHRNIPAFLINGKLSERSARRYAMARGILRPALRNVRAVLTQTEADADRYRMIMGSKMPIHVTGNVKFDGLPQPLSDDERNELRRLYGGEGDRLIFLAGSTHPGEEKLIYRAFRLYKEHGGPPARLVVAPRHPERFNEAAVELEKQGAYIHRASSEKPPSEEADTVLLDKMGVLGKSFGAADVAMVAGSWANIGGHNLLEPAAHGVPVVHGPNMHAQKEIMRIMTMAKASFEVPESLLDEALLKLATDKEYRQRLGSAGKAAAEANRGAARRTVEIVLESL